MVATLLLGAWLTGCTVLTPYEEVKNRLPPENFICIDQRSVYHESWGAGEPVLLLHSFGGSSHNFAGLADQLGPNWRLIAPDLVGFGHTERSPGLDDYAPTAQIAMLLKFLDELGLQKVRVVGHSYGGGLAMLLAQTHPDRVHSLALLAPIRHFGSPVRSFQHLGIRHLGYPLLVTALYSRSIFGIALRQAFFDISLVTPQRIEDYRSRLLIQGLAHAYHGHFRVDRLADAHRIRPPQIHHPTLILWGADDRVLPVKRYSAWLRDLPHYRSAILQDTGHMIAEESPDTAASLLEAFWTGRTSLKG